jgi:hypothetical protein
MTGNDTTGRVLRRPATLPLMTYEVGEKDGEIQFASERAAGTLESREEQP